MDQQELRRRIIGVTLLVTLLLVGCGAPTVTPVSEAPTATSTPALATPVPEALTPTPAPTLETLTPAIPIPDGLFPTMLTPAFLEDLYQQAKRQAQSDVPGAHFVEIEVEVNPFGSRLRPGITLIVRLRFVKDITDIYSYEWSDDTNYLAFKGQTHSLILIGGPPEAICDPLPWQREVDLEELVQYGYRNVYESFPEDADSHYFLGASALDTDCYWLASFWYGYNEQEKHLGDFFLADWGPIGPIPSKP